jgi:hypothetical protein
MGIRRVAFLAASACCVALASTTPVRAQVVVVTGQAPAVPPPPGYVPAPPPGYVPAPPPGYAPGYAPGYGPGYTTPVYQQTQPSYIPQSVAFSGPRIISDWSEGEPIPPGYHEAIRMRRGLVVGGAVLFGTMYLLTALVAAVESDNTSCGCHAGLFIPGAGPFVELGQSTGATTSFFLVVDGMSQLGGLAMFIAGLAVPKTVLIRNDLGSTSGFHLALSPIVGPGRSGMGVVGTF